MLIALGLLFTIPIVKAFAAGFEGDTLVLAVRFTRISIVGIYFTAITYIFSGYLQLKGNYLAPALIGLPYNLLIIMSIYMSYKSNVLVLSIGSIIAMASQLILLLPYIFKKGYKYKSIADFKDKNIKAMAYLIFPMIIGASVNQINTLVDRTIASTIAEGGISALNYANRLNGFILGIFVTSIATVIYPLISKMAAENNIDGLKKSASEAISSVNLLIIPTTIGAMLFAEPVVRLLFGRGAFDIQAITMTSSALFFYSIGMIGIGLRDILSRAFYSMQDTKTPMINAAISVVMNIVLNIILSRYMGIGGLALATSISAIFCTGLLFASLRKKIGHFGMKNVTISFIKIMVASVLMGVVAKLAYTALTSYTGQNLSLIISVATGASVYFAIVYFMKIEEMDVIVNTVKRKLKRDVA
jgi:putative peptidoglycan lipid II flippase